LNCCFDFLHAGRGISGNVGGSAGRICGGHGTSSHFKTAAVCAFELEAEVPQDFSTPTLFWRLESSLDLQVISVIVHCQPEWLSPG
jgi:hypothetical protein